MFRRSTFAVAFGLLLALGGCDDAAPIDPPPPGDAFYLGTLTSSLGVAPTGATVEFSDAAGTTYSATVSENGNFNVQAPPGLYTVRIAQDGFVPIEEGVQLQGTSTGTFDLRGSSRISALFMNSFYTSFPPSLSSADLTFRYQDYEFTQRTATDGTWTFDDAPLGDWEVTVEDENFLGTYAFVVEAEETPLGPIYPFILVPPTGHRYELTFTQGGPAYEDSFSLVLAWDQDRDGYADWYCEGYKCSRGGQEVIVRSNPDGEARQEEMILSKLLNGRYWLEVHSRTSSTYTEFPESFWIAEAKVQVYNGNDRLRTYRAPVDPDASGRVWHISDIDVSGGLVQYLDNSGQTHGYGNGN